MKYIKLYKEGDTLYQPSVALIEHEVGETLIYNRNNGVRDDEHPQEIYQKPDGSYEFDSQNRFTIGENSGEPTNYDAVGMFRIAKNN